MTAVQGFPPIADKHARVLVLGSMPGRASLAAGQYYAHARNAFWRIMAELLGFEATAPYAQRAQALRSARIALWDVLYACTRPGSLDASIERESEIANDFRSFFLEHKRITHVYFNGATAEACYRRHIAPALVPDARVYRRLPSTSPAHAGMPFADKVAAWRVILDAAAADTLPPDARPTRSRPRRR